MLGKVLRLPDSAWRSLTYGWALAFTFSGTVNIYVAYSYSLDTWVTFKFVGLLGLNLVFLMATFAFLHFKGLLTEEHLLDPNNSDSLDHAAKTKTKR